MPVDQQVFNGENSPLSSRMQAWHNKTTQVTFHVCILTNHDPIYRGPTKQKKWGGGGGGARENHPHLKKMEMALTSGTI